MWAMPSRRRTTFPTFSSRASKRRPCASLSCLTGIIAGLPLGRQLGSTSLQNATAYRRLVGTGIATVSEAASGILSGDAVERGGKRLFKGFDSTCADPAQIGFHLGPGGFDRAEVRTVGRQVAIGKA